MDLFDGAVRVDHFARGTDVYFLTHYHSDHMSGLKAGWHRGTIFCSRDTAALLRAGKGLPEDRIHVLPLEKPETIELLHGPVTVTAFDANHCPGACMFHFENGKERTLVTGDFRLDDAMRKRLPRFEGVDTLLVDVTYDRPRYAFPTQADVIEKIVQRVAASDKELTAVLTYTVGKNKILNGLFEAFGEPFFLEPRHLPLFQALGYGNMVTGDPDHARFFALGPRALEPTLRRLHGNWRRKALVIHPTGWAVDGRIRPGSVGFPYSEHCSWPELCEFLEAVQPGRIVVTEGGKATRRSLDWKPLDRGTVLD